MFTKLFYGSLMLLLLTIFGCNGVKTTADDKEVAQASGVDDDPSITEVATKDSKETLLSDRYPINQFECRDQIIALAKEIKRHIEKPAITDEERFANYSICSLRLVDNFALLRKYCTEDKDRLFRQRLDFHIALHRQISAIWEQDDKEVIKTPVGEIRMADTDNFHDKFLELIIQNKKPALFKKIGKEGLEKFSSEVIHCDAGNALCGRIVRLPLPDGIGDPISFCADYVEKYYRNVIEPNQEAYSFLKEHLGEDFEKLMKKVLGGVDFEVFHPIKGDKNKREEIIRMIEKHNPENAKKVREWVNKKRRLFLQQTQETVKHQLVLVQRAEEEFRKQDANGNGVEDYWTADISGLYRLKHAKAKANSKDSIKLIDLFLVHLDGSPLPNSTDGCVDMPKLPPNFDVDIFPYRLQVVKQDAAGHAIAKATDNSGRPWFNKEQFAIVAYPTQYPRLGRNTYLIDESHQIWMKDTQGKPVEKRPADYEAAGWSKTKFTPQYVREVERDAGPIKYKTRVMNRLDELLFDVQQREKLLKAGVIKRTTLEKKNDKPVKYDPAAVLVKIDAAIAKAGDPKIKTTLLTMRKYVEGEGTNLDLNGKQLTSLPPEIGMLTNLKELNLEDNQLTSLPPEIGKLRKLTNLDLTNNQLSTLPAEIGKLKNLVWLSLNSNQLTILPPEFGELANLADLFFCENQLTSIPPEIWQLTKLTVLSFTGNQLSTLPPEIGKLSKLTTLSLRKNQLSTLPPEIEKLTKLTTLYLTGNPVTIAILEQLKSLKSLTAVGIGRTKINKEGVVAIEKALPRLYISLEG